MSEAAADTLFRVLRDDLISGGYREGERLPSERDLAREHHLSRPTVRAAVGRLASLGLVTVKRGDGIRAAGLRRAANLDFVTHLLESASAPSVPIKVVEDMLQLHRIIASEAVGQACRKATADQIATLSELAALQARRVDDPEAFRQGDLDFARAVLRIADNLAMELLLSTIERFYETRPEVGHALLGEPKVTVASYHAAIALISQPDAEAACRRTREFLRVLDSQALERFRAAQEQAEADATEQTAILDLLTAILDASEPRPSEGDP